MPFLRIFISTRLEAENAFFRRGGIMKKYCLILFALLVFTSSVAQTTDTLSLPSLYPSTFSTYDIEQGLLISCIEETFTDSKGRMWINPCRILDIHRKQRFFQFDGNKSYPVPLPDPGGHPLSSSWFIIDIAPNGDLVGANLSRTHAFFYTPETQESQIFSFEKGEQIMNLLVQEDNKVIAIIKGPGKYSLYLLNATQKEWLNSIELDIPNQDLSHFNTDAIQNQDVIIFLHHDEGFVQFDLTSKSIKAYLWKELLEGFGPNFQNVQLTTIEKGKATFFISSPDSFFEYDILSGQLNPDIKFNGLFNSLPKSDHQGAEVGFFKDKSGNILLGISWWPLKGIYPQQSLFLIDSIGKYYNYQSIINEVNKANRYGTVFSDERPLRAKFFNSKNLKKEAVISTEGGLHIVELQSALQIDAYLKGWASRAILEWSPNKIAVISDNGYFRQVDLMGKEDTYLDNNFGQLICNENISVSPFTKVIHRDDQSMWFSAGQDLICYQKQQNFCTSYPINQQVDKFNFLSEKEIILTSIQQGDVYIYNIDQKKLRPYSIGGTPLNVGSKTNEILISKDGTIWIATLNGLWKIDQKSNNVLHLNEQNGLNNNQVICIREADDGKIWMGMINGGLQIYDPKSGEFKLIDESNGLSNNSVVGILEDEDGDKWVSTFSGITVLSSQEEILFKIYEKDGLSHKEFNRFSFYKMKDGRFILGTVSGINILDPKEIKPAFTQREKLFLYLTEINYFNNQIGKDTLLRGQFENIQTITLPATHRYLNIDFSLSDYIHAPNSSFAYQLAGPGGLDTENNKEETWINIGSNSFLTLNDLPAGKHTLLIKGTDHTGQIIEDMISIPIKVKEFFYKTWWFYTLLTLPFILGVILWNRRLVTDKKRLEEEVEKRTHQIQLDKKLIEQQASKLQDLDKMKSRFFTNISHEFRTPLTIITGMANQVKAYPDQWLEKGNELIVRNSQHLLSLINQILDLRKLESGALKVNMLRGDIIPYLNYIADSFSPMAQSGGIKIHFLTNVKNLEIDYDPDKMLHILSNLLSNAIKYSPDGGDIYLQVDQKLVKDIDTLAIQVKDTGQGISQEALPYIFDRFYQVEDLANQKPQGSGVGLALTRELVHLLNGTIEVESYPDLSSGEATSEKSSSRKKGTCFTLNFPITQKAPLQEIAPTISSSKHENKSSVSASAPIIPIESPKKENNSENRIELIHEPEELPHLLIVEGQ